MLYRLSYRPFPSAGLLFIQCTIRAAGYLGR
jgi:hypothetical protein